MTVSSSTRSAGPFNGNGVTTEFPFAFKVFSSDDVAVYFTGADGVQTLLDVGYTVSLNEDQDSDPGGTVTYPVSGDPLASGETLAIIGALSYEQQTDLTNSGRYLPEVVEAALDYITILCQQLLERGDRKLSLPAGDAGQTDLPTASARAGNFLAFDEDGDPIAAAGTTEVPVSAFMATVLDDETAAAARATLGATATGEALFMAASAAAAFAAIKQAASDTATGVVELATNAEAQAGTDTARAITPSAMKAAQIVLGTAVASTSGTAIDFTGIPSYAKRVTIPLSVVSTNGTSNYLVQLGDSGGIETTSYVSGVAGIQGTNATAISSATSGFALQTAADAAATYSGVIQLVKLDGNTWVCVSSLSASNGVTYSQNGTKTLSATLDRVRLTTSGGVNTFDAGSVNVSWE